MFSATSEPLSGSEEDQTSADGKAEEPLNDEEADQSVKMRIHQDEFHFTQN